MTRDDIELLLSSVAYSHSITDVRLIETYISWVVLTGDYAYKIKKPVVLNYLDFSTLEKRRHYCSRELELNRRLAAPLYCAVEPVTKTLSGAGEEVSLEINGQGDIIDYAVKMKQFDDEALLSYRVTLHPLPETVWEKLADKIAHFHASAERYIDSEYGDRKAIKYAVEQNVVQIRPYLTLKDDIHLLGHIDAWMQEVYLCEEAIMVKRKRKGFVRDCHGDLHLGNMVLIDDEIIPFDCIEFNRHFRIIDVASEIAFTVMDLEVRGLIAEASRFLNFYLEISGDYEVLALLCFYKVYRAMVRAKVILLATSIKDRKSLPGTEPYRQFQRYLQLAHRYLEEPPVFLAIMHGVSGSGKSYIARQLAESLGAIRIRSDVERKRIYGIDRMASGQSALDKGIYSDVATDRTFKKLEELALAVVDDGYSCIVDATFLDSFRRQAFHRLAKHCDVPFIIIDCRASEQVVVERLLDRTLKANDPSEADEVVMREQLQKKEPLSAQELEFTFIVDTQKPFEMQCFKEALGI